LFLPVFSGFRYNHVAADHDAHHPQAQPAAWHRIPAQEQDPSDPVPGPAAKMPNTRFPDCDCGENPYMESSENEALDEEFKLP
jgi:hypothetical protein